MYFALQGGQRERVVALGEEHNAATRKTDRKSRAAFELTDYVYYSCVDCFLTNCKGSEGNYPVFCPTSELSGGTLNTALAILRTP